MTAFLFGYTIFDGNTHVVCDAKRHRTVCGQVLAFVPELQPNNPPAVCPNCVLLEVNLPGARREQMTGDCPVCGNPEDLDEQGRIGSHRKAVVQSGGRIGRAGDDDCPGVGQPPDSDDESPDLHLYQRLIADGWTDSTIRSRFRIGEWTVRKLRAESFPQHADSQ